MSGRAVQGWLRRGAGVQGCEIYEDVRILQLVVVGNRDGWRGRYGVLKLLDKIDLNQAILLFVVSEFFITYTGVTTSNISGYNKVCCENKIMLTKAL